MIRKVDGGAIPPAESQSTTPLEKQAEQPKTETTQQTSPEQTLTREASEASARISERALTGQLVAAQLQSQIQKENAVGAAVPPEPKLLVEGSVGPEVKDFQKDLNVWRSSQGLDPIKEDGIFGPETKAAVQNFQETNGLKKDGIVGGNTRDRLTVENDPNFQNLNPDTKEEIRGKMNDSQSDPVTRRNLKFIATDKNFAKLDRTEQHDALQDPAATASNLAQQRLSQTSNEDLLKQAETPEGAKQLAEMKSILLQGEMTPEKAKQLDRINSATFTPAGGLNVQGSAADRAAYLHIVRREMLASPSFAKTMNEINGDKAHPVTVKVGRDLPRIALDAFRKDGQVVDLNDFDKLPVKPDASNPHAITQGEVMIHAMREARQAKLGVDFADAHAAAIDEENNYRRDIGQTTFRKAPPNDEDRKDNDLGGTDIVIHFDNAPDEVLRFDNQSKLQR